MTSNVISHVEMLSAVRDVFRMFLSVVCRAADAVGVFGTINMSRDPVVGGRAANNRD